MAKFPPDRFDGVPESPLRVGAHRSGVKRHGGWIVFAWAALACLVLVGIGVAVLKITDSNNQFHDTSTTAPSISATPGSSSGTPSPGASTSTTPTVAPTPTPLLDPSQINSAVTTITVLNSTKTAGLAANAGGALKNGGWVVGNEGNATTEVPTSVVYYDSSAADNESIALGIAKTLGISQVQQSTAFPSSTITVVLGSDYVSK
ncbi:hypothetical protein AX769_07050 [Frondihabitans sp. PAMC 28766]|uniref:LytR C-terminal domain-containing protein n=1 Tax=Frondihabitans sp. PAMC 28766 TaxID=1795630 RepID=UPI00078D06C1|nr:LytR C-terminal domain-containing protein [Frondihabitans sp. PAMC 28766]AMM19958.1 hypothetical protein AX769_07050 [Frondihabitans sp. PAMC 28766]